MEELEKNMQPNNSGASGKELYELKKQDRFRGNKQKHRREQKERRKENLGKAPRKIGNLLLYAAIIAGIIFGIRALTQLGSQLPPTSQLGHTEISPQSHISDSPMGDKIQKHMLEHADGSGQPGIIIQYNCDDYECGPDLVAQLTALVERFPANVYLAPNNYDGKIILTKEGSIEILEDFNEEAIVSFIGARFEPQSESDSPSLGVPAPGHENMDEMMVGPSDDEEEGQDEEEPSRF